MNLTNQPGANTMEHPTIHLADNEKFIETYWAAGGYGFFHRYATQAEAETACERLGTNYVELRMVTDLVTETRVGTVRSKPDAPILRYTPQVVLDRESTPDRPMTQVITTVLV